MNRKFYRQFERFQTNYITLLNTNSISHLGAFGQKGEKGYTGQKGNY